MLKNKSIKELSFIALILVTFFWSFGFIATQIGIDAGYDTESIIAFRFGIGSILIFLLKPKRILKSSKTTFIHGLLAGIFIYLAFYTQILGQNYASISNVALIGSCYVVFVPFVSWILLRKRPSLLSFILTGFAVLGMVVLNLGDGGISFGYEDILLFLCAIFFAVHVSFLSSHCTEDELFGLTFFQLFTAFVIALIAMLIKGTNLAQSNFSQGWTGLLYLGVFSTFVCYFLQTFAQQNLPAVDVSIILCLEGVFAAILSMLLGYENFRANVAIGGLIILACCIAVNLKIENKE